MTLRSRSWRSDSTSHPARLMSDRTLWMWEKIVYICVCFLLNGVLGLILQSDVGDSAKRMCVSLRLLPRMCCRRLMWSRQQETLCVSSKSCSVLHPEEGRKSTLTHTHVLIHLITVTWHAFIRKLTCLHRRPHNSSHFPPSDTTSASTQPSFTSMVKHLTTRFLTPPSSVYSCCHTKIRGRCSLWWVDLFSWTLFSLRMLWFTMKLVS